MEPSRHFPDVTGRILWVEVAGANESSRDGILVESPQFMMVGERPFVTGRVAQIGVAWDAVIHYMIFDSAEDYAQRMSTSVGYRS